MQGRGHRPIDSQVPSQLDGTAEGFDQVTVTHGHLHGANNMPDWHLAQGQIVLCKVCRRGIILPGMAKGKEAAAAPEEWRQTGQRIRTIRELSGLKQAQISALLGASQGQWSRWELGERLPPEPIMKKFAARAQTSLDLIYSGRPVGTSDVLLRLLQAKVPHLLVTDPTDTGPDMDKDLASYKSSMHQEPD